MWKPGGGTYQDIPLDVTSTCDIVHCVNNTNMKNIAAMQQHCTCVTWPYDNASTKKAHQNRVFSVMNKVRIVRLIGNDR